MLTVRDETPAGETGHEFALEFLTETITVRELIRSRVYQEVQDYNVRQRMTGPFRGLVQPRVHEVACEGLPVATAPRPIDWQQQYERAVEAFEHNQVLILIDDRQAELLDETFTIRPDTSVTFLRLTLLVGG
jgi:hypothetical protein